MSGAARAVRLGAVVLLGFSLACAKPLWEQPPPQAREAPIVRPGSLTRSTLPNGVQVLVLEDRRLPLVSIGVAVRRGAGAVAPERAGLGSFTAELMNRGAGDRGARALAEFVDSM
ncbi:MAG: insulinase family protein, partial [Deltaproteobacteria bacterium]|nr:insulinase family protein [Deltaproteobacteria bacterium]